MDDYDYRYYLTFGNNKNLEYIKIGTYLMNNTGNQSKILDDCTISTFEQQSKLAEKIDVETKKSIHNILAAASTCGMYIYAAVHVVRKTNPDVRFNIDPRKLIDYVNSSQEKYNELLSKYDVIPIITTRTKILFGHLVDEQPHIVRYPYYEVDYIKELVQGSIELGFILTLSLCEGVS